MKRCDKRMRFKGYADGGKVVPQAPPPPPKPVVPPKERRIDVSNAPKVLKSVVADRKKMLDDI